MLFFGCGSNKELVKYLRECKNLESDKYNFVLIDKDELQNNLGRDESLRYIGSDGEFHYLIHYYDKTVKIQSRFKIFENGNSIEKRIDLNQNLNALETNRKFNDSYFLNLADL